MSRLPNFLYVGPDKAGSSWLHEVLLKHPDVYLTPAKDLYFFDRYYDHGLAWYLAHFAPATDQAVVGEVCQDYLFHPEAAQRIRDSLGTARFMVTLRDPADRAMAAVDQAVATCFDSEDYREGRTAFMEKRAPKFQGR